MSRTIEALQILKDHPEISATSFALFFWPDSNMHKKTSNQGHGACRGKAAWLAAGSFMGKLKKKGLVKDVLFDKYGNPTGSSCYKLTIKGEEELNKLY